jgi:hypothetical protein
MISEHRDPAVPAFGFREAGYRKNYFGPGEHRTLMTHRLGGIPTPRPDRGQG